jgi:hypothetical protein
MCIGNPQEAACQGRTAGGRGTKSQRQGGDAGAGGPEGARRDRARGAAQRALAVGAAEAALLEAAVERSQVERKSRALAYLLTQAGKVTEAAARNQGGE